MSTRRIFFYSSQTSWIPYTKKFREVIYWQQHSSTALTLKCMIRIDFTCYPRRSEELIQEQLEGNLRILKFHPTWKRNCTINLHGEAKLWSVTRLEDKDFKSTSPLPPPCSSGLYFHVFLLALQTLHSQGSWKSWKCTIQPSGSACSLPHISSLSPCLWHQIIRKSLQIRNQVSKAWKTFYE